MQKVVLDTNVLVSALLTPNGNSARILDLVINGQLLICFESRIISEYLDVLNRPKFHFNHLEIERLIQLMMQTGLSVIAQPSTDKFTDESDRVFFDVARTAGAILVTGNLKHYPINQDFICSPSELCKMLELLQE